MARFTVLGASGFLGGTLATRLAADGHEVFRPSRTELHSLSDRDLGHVFYSLNTKDARIDAYGAFQSHVAYLAQILRFSVFSSLTYVSSTRIYLGAQCSHEQSELKILPHDDNAIFNAMKLAAEQLCFAIDNPAIRVVRLSNLIGFAPNGISLIPVLIKDALQKGKMHLTISPQSSKDYIAIEDALGLLPRIALEGRLRCYNVASGANVTLGEIVRAVQNEIPSLDEWTPNAPTIIFPTIDVRRIHAEFAFVHRPLHGALASAVAQYRRHLTTSHAFAQ